MSDPTNTTQKSNGTPPEKDVSETAQEVNEVPSEASSEAGEGETLQVGDEKRAAFISELPDDLEELKNRLYDTQQKADEHMDDLRRNLAEFANFRRRTSAEFATSRTRGKFDMLETLIPVLDDIDQGVKNSEEGPVKESLQLIQQKYRRILAQQDIEVVDPAGSTFDPNTAEAITTLHVPGHEPNTVIDTLAVCYQSKDGNVLRPARVVVAADPA